MRPWHGLATGSGRTGQGQAGLGPRLGTGVGRAGAGAVRGPPPHPTGILPVAFATLSPPPTGHTQHRYLQSKTEPTNTTNN